MSTEYRCGKCGSVMLRVYQDGSGFCMACNDTFASIDDRTVNAVPEDSAGMTGEQFKREFNYTLNTKDIVSALKLVSGANNTERGIGMLLLASVIIMLVILIVLYPNDINEDLILLFAALIILLFVATDIPLKITIREKPDDYALDKPLQLTFDNEKIEMKEKDSECQLSWRAVKIIINDKHSVCIVLIDRRMIILPRRVFEDNTDCDSFIQKAMEQQSIAWNNPLRKSFMYLDTQIHGDEWTGGSEPFNYAFSFTLTKRDLKTYWSYSALNYTYKRKNLVYAAVVLSIMLLFIIMLPVSKDTQSFLLFAWAVGAIFQIAISFNAIDRTRIKSRPFEYGVDIPRILIFNTESFIVKLAEGIYKYPLSSIELIHETREYAYFFLHSRRAIILPKRVFKKESEYDVFIKRMKEVHARVAKPKIEK